MSFFLGFITGVMVIWIITNFIVRGNGRRYKLEIKFYKEEIMRLNELIIKQEMEKKETMKISNIPFELPDDYYESDDYKV